MESQSGRNVDQDVDAIDRISSLPDDLLHRFLVRLRCTRAAARTSLLSRRWRGLWRHLPEIYLSDISPDAVVAALAQVTPAELSVLDIHVPDRHRCSPAGVASLLRTAAWMVPVVLSFVVFGDNKDFGVANAIEMPCFHRATSIKLRLYGFDLVAVEFPVVERLHIAGCRIDTGTLVKRCPRLLVLELRNYWGLDIVMVHSSTIEELEVNGRARIRGFDIKAPKLKKFTLSASMAPDFSMSLSAPAVEELMALQLLPKECRNQ